MVIVVMSCIPHSGIFFAVHVTDWTTWCAALLQQHS